MSQDQRVRVVEPCMFCGQPLTPEELDPCQVVVTNQWGRPDDAQMTQRFWSHAACLRSRLDPTVAEDAYVLDPESNAPEEQDETDDLAPITMTWHAVSTWLRERPFDTSFVAERVAWSPVFSARSLKPGRRELDKVWRLGDEPSWVGGPAAPPLAEWPRRPDGKPLAHVLTVSLYEVDGAFDEPYKDAFPDHRQGLPTAGLLEVFHDLETYGWKPTDAASGGWLVRWVPEPEHPALVDPPDDVDTPTEVCQLGYLMPGWSLPSPMDVAGTTDFDAVAALTEDHQRAWLYQQTGSAVGQPVPVTHVYGHSQNGSREALRILADVLPLDDGDSYRLVLDIESWTHLDGWFGDAAPLEVWMRDTDLQGRRFDRAWCIIRTD